MLTVRAQLVIQETHSYGRARRAAGGQDRVGKEVFDWLKAS